MQNEYSIQGVGTDYNLGGVPGDYGLPAMQKEFDLSSSELVDLDEDMSRADMTHEGSMELISAGDMDQLQLSLEIEKERYLSF